MSFSYKENDKFELSQGLVNAQTIIDGIDEITERERTPRSKIIMKALAEYWEKHAPGNAQTQMPSFSEGGVQNKNQLVGQIRQVFYNRGKVTRSEILERLKLEDLKGSERASMTKGIIRWLKENGVTVTY